ncbi:hypothetical protein DICVIV_12008 [Dictyocaulus viviparus]|uniref:MAP3K deoxyribohydrolase domain-containing protein n=1 Tax=Dictyocaulus viviparus TaxID=29172 RepID=A0A0D8XI44_DICVI|nr:hypothetical protein DICVIV_12008 [Dictyocaulus viviparus]
MKLSDVNIEVCPISLSSRSTLGRTGSPSFQRTPQSPGSNTDKMGPNFTRKLQVVIVIDQKVQKNLRVREMALKDVQNVADTLNVNLTQIDFDRLDFGEANALDTFYNADVALVDVTVQQQQPSLCYHIDCSHRFTNITLHHPANELLLVYHFFFVGPQSDGAHRERYIAGAFLVIGKNNLDYPAIPFIP